MFSVFFIFWCLHASSATSEDNDTAPLYSRLFAEKIVLIAKIDTSYPQVWKAWVSQMNWGHVPQNLKPEALNLPHSPMYIEEDFKEKIFPESLFSKALSILKAHRISIAADEKVYEKLEAALIQAATPSSLLKKMLTFNKDPDLVAPVHSALQALWQANQKIRAHIVPHLNKYLIVGDKLDPWSVVAAIDESAQTTHIKPYALAAKDMLPLVNKSSTLFRRAILSHIKHGTNLDSEYSDVFKKHQEIFKDLKARIQFLQHLLSLDAAPYINDLADNAATLTDSLQNMVSSHIGIYNLCRTMSDRLHVPNFTLGDIVQHLHGLGGCGTWKKQALKEFLFSGKLEGDAAILYKDFFLMEQILPLNIYTQVWALLPKNLKTHEHIMIPRNYQEAINKSLVCLGDTPAVQRASRAMSEYIDWNSLPKTTLYGHPYVDWKLSEVQAVFQRMYFASSKEDLATTAL